MTSKHTAPGRGASLTRESSLVARAPSWRLVLNLLAAGCLLTTVACSGGGGGGSDGTAAAAAPRTTPPASTPSTTPPAGSGGGTTTPPPAPVPMQTSIVRFLPSASPGVLGYSLSIANSPGAYGAGTQIDIPVAAAQTASGGVLEFAVSISANVPHYIAMQAYSAQAFSGFSNEVVIPAVAAPTSSPTPVSAPSAAAGTSLSMPVANALTSGVASGSGTAVATGESSSGSTSPTATSASTASASVTAMSSLDLDGSGEYLASSAPYALGVTQQFTLSIWALADPLASGSRALITLRGGVSGQQNRVELISYTNNLQMTVYNDAGLLVYQAFYAATIVPGSWQHIALTFDASVDSAPVLLVDGTVRAPASAVLTGNAATFSDSAGRIFIGASSTGSVATWFGAIGHAALWNVALGDDEIAEISLRGHSLDLRENQGAYLAKDALLHYWRLGEDPTAVGFDYGAAAVPIDLDDPAGNVDAADIVPDAPVLLQ